MSRKGTWQQMELEVPIEENGYIYIYVANESVDNVNVYFDDLEVILIESPVTNASDYYPFGLAMNGRSWSSEPYRFGYQGQFAEMDEETGWNHFESRSWNPIIGRWFAMDPQRQFASPYLGMGNNPVNGVDPDGELFFGLFGSTSAQRQAARELKDNNGGQINNLLSKDISWSYNGYEYDIGQNGWTAYNYYSVDIAKDGTIGAVQTNEILSAVDGIDFDPLTQLSLGFLATSGISAASSLRIPTLGLTTARFSVSTGLADINAATTFAYIRGSAMLGRGVGYVGAGYFYTGYRLFGDKFTRLHPRLLTQMDIGHRAATFLRSDFLTQFPKVRNWNTIYWQTSQGSGYFHIGVNPWTRTIFYEAYGSRPFGN